MRVVIFHILLLLCLLLRLDAGGWREINSVVTDNNRKIPIMKVETLTDSCNVFYEITNEMVSMVKGIKRRGEDIEYTKVKLGGCDNIYYPGEPSLPFISLRLIIPQGKDIAEVMTTFSNKTEMSANVNVEYGEKTFDPSVKQGNSTEKNIGIYESNVDYPYENYEIASIQKQFGVKIAFVNIFPLKCIPKSKILNLYKSLKVKVTFKDDKSRDNDLQIRTERIDNTVFKLDNPDELNSYRNIRIQNTYGEIANYRTVYDYVIITNEEFKNAQTDWSLNDLVEQRETQGLSIKIVTVEEIYSSYSGVDQQEKIRNFIKDAYNNWDTKYVFLAGDSNIIPARILTPDRWPLGGAAEAYIPSDIYYQCLDGNYNVNNDSWWGEEKDGQNWGWIDILAEVSIGRAPAENISEMSNFIYKTLSYENDSEDESYLKNVLFLGEYLGFYQDSEYSKEHMEEIRNGSDLHNYVTKGFSSDNTISTSVLYEKDQSWGKGDIINLINSNEFGVIQHLGHGMSTEVMHIANIDADNLSNNKFPFIYTQACFCGKFTRDCVAEHLVTSTRHGAWGGVFNGESGRVNAAKTLGPSQRMNRWFWDSYFRNGVSRVGDMNRYSHNQCADVNILKLPDVLHCIYVTNLLADPYTSLKFKDDDQKVAITDHFKKYDLKKNNGLNNFLTVPNPANINNDNVRIFLPQNKDLLNVSIEIFDMLGDVIFKKSVACVKGGCFEWDLKNTKGKKVSTGVYKIIITGIEKESGENVYWLNGLGIKE